MKLKAYIFASAVLAMLVSVFAFVERFAVEAAYLASLGIFMMTLLIALIVQELVERLGDYRVDATPTGMLSDYLEEE